MEQSSDLLFSITELYIGLLFCTEWHIEIHEIQLCFFFLSDNAH